MESFLAKPHITAQNLMQPHVILA